MLLQLTAAEWNLDKKQDGVTVYTREVNGSDFLAFKGIVEVDAPLEAIVAFLYDTPRTPEWINDCDFAMTLEEVTFRDNYIYQTFDLPFPVCNRALILHSTLTYTKEGASLRSVSASNFCTDKKSKRCGVVQTNEMLMIKRSIGVYRLIVLSENKTKIIWTLHTEPGGYIPTWLANALVVDLPFHSLSKLRKMVMEPQYFTMSRTRLKELWLDEYQQFH